MTKNGEWSFFSYQTEATGALVGLKIQVQRTSSVGDPDVYLAFEKIPTLFEYEEKEASCDTCEYNDAESPIRELFTVVSEPQTMLIIGVYGYCCNDVEFNVRVQEANDDDSAFRHYKIPQIETLTLLALISITLCMVGSIYVMWVQRRRRRYQQFELIPHNLQQP